MRENSATLLSTAPLPPGADDASTWEDWDNTFRVNYTPEIKIAGTGCNIFGTAVQLPDGTIASGGNDAPRVNVQAGTDGITVAQARQVVAAIVATADLIEGWAR